MRTLHLISLALLIIGGLNWGVAGLAQQDLLMPILGQAARVVYVIVGLAALFEIYAWVTMRDVAYQPAPRSSPPRP